MTARTDAIVDHYGRVMFRCRTCADPLSRDDLAEAGLRAPEHGEDFDDYCAAELMEARDFEHAACTRRRLSAAG